MSVSSLCIIYLYLIIVNFSIIVNNIMNNQYDYLFKFILVGQSSVGKSCLLLRFLEGRFKNQHQPTLGVEFGAKNIHVDDRKVKLQVWDTAGQQSFRSITRAYYRGSIVALLVFDLSNEGSFQALKHWLRQVKTNSHNKIRLCLIGNKSDLKEDRQIQQETINQFLQTNSIEQYFQTSALTGENSDEPFIKMANLIMKAVDSGQINPEQDQAYGVKLHPRKTANMSPTIKAFSDTRNRNNTDHYQKDGCNC